jgi:hypothetical protein
MSYKQFDFDYEYSRTREAYEQAQAVVRILGKYQNHVKDLQLDTVPPDAEFSGDSNNPGTIARLVLTLSNADVEKLFEKALETAQANLHAAGGRLKTAIDNGNGPQAKPPNLVELRK